MMWRYARASIPTSKSSRQSLISLGFGVRATASAALQRASEFSGTSAGLEECADPGLLERAEAKMYTANLAQMWPEVDNEHVLDAIGLGMTIARGLFSPDQLITWIYDPKCHTKTPRFEIFQPLSARRRSAKPRPQRAGTRSSSRLGASGQPTGRCAPLPNAGGGRIPAGEFPRSDIMASKRSPRSVTLTASPATSG